MSWLLVVLPLLALLFVLPPLFKPGRDTEAERESTLDALREKRRNLIGSIRELDFDREMGKMSEEDHAEQREALKAEAAKTIRDLEKREGKGKRRG